MFELIWASIQTDWQWHTSCCTQHYLSPPAEAELCTNGSLSGLITSRLTRLQLGRFGFPRNRLSRSDALKRLILFRDWLTWTRVNKENHLSRHWLSLWPQRERLSVPFRASLWRHCVGSLRVQRRLPATVWFSVVPGCERERRRLIDVLWPWKTGNLSRVKTCPHPKTAGFDRSHRPASVVQEKLNSMAYGSSRGWS